MKRKEVGLMKRQCKGVGIDRLMSIGICVCVRVQEGDGSLDATIME